jgi:hypothetical protein
VRALPGLGYAQGAVVFVGFLLLSAFGLACGRHGSSFTG